MLTGQFEKLAGKLFPGKETADQLLNECRLMTESGEITALLRAWQEGDQGALEPLTQSVHAELRRLAGSAFRGERAGHTLQPTALVNEAFIKLVQADIGWQSRAHFFALSARMMRRHGISCLPVVQDERPVGILTTTDLLLHCMTVFPDSG